MELDEENSEIEVQDTKDLSITKAAANKNYHEAGKLVDEDADEINLEAYSHLLCDSVHLKLMEVLEDVQLPFELSDFQKISLHVIGSKRNLILIRETFITKLDIYGFFFVHFLDSSLKMLLRP